MTSLKRKCQEIVFVGNTHNLLKPWHKLATSTKWQYIFTNFLMPTTV